VKERGILLSGKMVPPVLADTKLQTRRILTEQPYSVWGYGVPLPHVDKQRRFGINAAFNVCEMRVDRWLPCPYGAPGDRLWVREAWRTVESLDPLSPSQLEPRVPVRYECDGVERGKFREPTGRYRHGRFMPRWASRSTLEVTGIRVERLQVITEEDARAEGVKLGELVDAIVNGERSKVVYFEARTAFAHLWCGINGPESWKANPWVWVVEFKRIAEAAKERAA
jgi:hypothetical protein